LGQPRILLLDIETAPILMAAWTIYEANAVWVERDTFILSFAAKWLGGKPVKTYALPDYPRYKTHKHDDKPLVRDLWALMDEADIIVAHNGDSFDIKKINARFAVHGMRPPSPYKTVDTLKIARRVFKFDSNKLDNIGRYLKEGRKIPNTGAALWRGCVDGDPKSWDAMRKYNAQDVSPLLERVYHRLKCWDRSHPNLNRYTEQQEACPVCQSQHVERRGFNVAMARKAQRLQCRDCGHWFSQPIKRGSCTNRSAPTSRATRPAARGTRKTLGDTRNRASLRTNRSRPASAKTHRRKR
jgi:hypothetical protein